MGELLAQSKGLWDYKGSVPAALTLRRCQRTCGWAGPLNHLVPQLMLSPSSGGGPTHRVAGLRCQGAQRHPGWLGYLQPAVSFLTLEDSKNQVAH